MILKDLIDVIYVLEMRDANSKFFIPFLKRDKGNVFGGLVKIMLLLFNLCILSFGPLRYIYDVIFGFISQFAVPIVDYSLLFKL